MDASDAAQFPEEDLMNSALRAPVRLAGALLLALLLAGCGKKLKLQVDSNTTWSGSYGSVRGANWSTADVAGTGSRTFDLPDDDRVCCAFTQTGTGYLKITIKDEGGGPGHLFADDSRSTETNVHGGTADLCTEGTVPR